MLSAGDIIAIGDGKVGDKQQDFYLEVGQTVLYSKFGIGVTDLMVQGEEHCLIKEDDCIGIMPQSGATANDIPQLKPNGDRVLLKASLSQQACCVLCLYMLSWKQAWTKVIIQIVRRFQSEA